MERQDVRTVAGLRWLMRRLLGNAGLDFSGEKLHRVLKSQGVSIVENTPHRLPSHSDDCFL